MKKIIYKILPVIILLAFAGQAVSAYAPGLGDPFSVPTRLKGGDLDRLGKVGQVASLELDKTAKWQEIVRAGNMAAINSFLNYGSRKFKETVETRLGVKDPYTYLAALKEGKTYNTVYRKNFGQGAVPTSTLGYIDNIATDFENLPLSRTTQSNAEKLAIQSLHASSPEQLERNIKQLLIGGSSLFTSSITCAGLDKDALRNTAEYLAATSRGMRADELNPEEGLKFYSDLLAFADPQADSSYWISHLRDVGRQTEAEAEEAAKLELTSAGLKSPQTRNARGETEIARSVNLVSIGEENADEALFNIPLEAADSTYDTSSFSSFVGSLISLEIPNLVDFLFGKLFPDALNQTKLSDIGNNASFASIAQAAGRAVSTRIVQIYAVKLYNQVATTLFKGQILGESYGCREPVRLSRFTQDDKDFTAPANLAIDAYGDAPPPPASEVRFEAVPDEIRSGEAVTLSWYVDVDGSDITVNLSGGGLSGNVETSGSVTDTPTLTTTYTLTVTGADPPITPLTRQVRVVSGGPTTDFSQVRLFAETVSRASATGTAMALIWDATSVEDAGIAILGEDPETGTFEVGDDLPLQGRYPFTIFDQDFNFNMTIVAPNGDQDQKTITVEVPTATSTGSVEGALLRLSKTRPFKVRE